ATGGLLPHSFLDRLRRERYGRNPQNTSLIDGRIAVVTVIVVETINEIVVRSCARAIDADSQEPTSGGALHARCDRQQRIEIAPIQRHVFDLQTIYVVVLVG